MPHDAGRQNRPSAASDALGGLGRARGARRRAHGLACVALTVIGVESALERVVAFWDEHVAAWLAGQDLMTAPLPEWLASYQVRASVRSPVTGSPSRTPVLCLPRRGRCWASTPAGTSRTSRPVTASSPPRSASSARGWRPPRTCEPRGRSWWGPNRYYEAQVGFMRRRLDDPESGPATW
jgi:hypothetical protein